MRKLIILTLTIMAITTFAQTNLENKTKRKGMVVGFGLGAGALTLNTNDTIRKSFSTTLPNIKIGYMLNERLAFHAILPGANYRYKGNDRGFEGVVITCQYWLRDKWWIMGGAGLTFDAPAFYTVKDPKTAEFYLGIPSFTFASGYEIWKKGRFAIDLQYRIFAGAPDLPNGRKREGLSNMFIVGFNWY